MALPKIGSRAQRKALVKKVSYSLARHTAGLDATERLGRYEKTKEALTVRFTLDKMGVF